MSSHINVEYLLPAFLQPKTLLTDKYHILSATISSLTNHLVCSIFTLLVLECISVQCLPFVNVLMLFGGGGSTSAYFKLITVARLRSLGSKQSTYQLYQTNNSRRNIHNYNERLTRSLDLTALNLSLLLNYRSWQLVGI
jgi:hypothetical protein